MLLSAVLAAVGRHRFPLGLHNPSLRIFCAPVLLCGLKLGFDRTLARDILIRQASVRWRSDTRHAKCPVRL